jgi:hypothetical protein
MSRRSGYRFADKDMRKRMTLKRVRFLLQEDAL